MTYLDEPEPSAERDALYADDVAHQGYVADFTRVFAYRPEVYRAWESLNKAVKAEMPFERYEVATITAAQARGSDYCALAHGGKLSGVLDVATVVQIADGTDSDPERQAIRTLAAKVATSPAAVTADDLQPLRDLGMSDADVLDVVLATAARCFFSTVLSATGAEPDAALTGQDPTMVAALTRPASS